MSRGFVYILSNPSMPGLVKIGKTIRSVEGRANELYQTGVPTPFKVEYSVEAPDCHALELAMHGYFAEKRVSEGREFFTVSAIDAYEALQSELYEQVSGWVSDFLPEHTLVENDLFVDPSILHKIAHDIDEHPFSIDLIIEFLRPEDFAFAKAKYSQWVAGRKALMASRQEVVQ